MKLFLDDIRTPYDVFKLTVNPLYESDSEWVIVRDYYQFIDAINKFGLPTHISFDHDLSYDAYLPENQKGDIDYTSLKEKTGYDACKWLCEYCLGVGKDIPEYVVHSANPVGAENIKRYLENFKKRVLC
jgi:hypothetical protein